ncbi:hypothetical protein [Streptomyces sp. Isolate_219]|uniref:hypothetical protein n=1 Tax=Streptomyces sp. Isolate_219 TaxID=2950110 RepID=UPI0021C9BA1A|nr:hypothetical protein [Streptomyces sp. Isolate_219]MCR8576174.1 hypothetical protein [Streptomyces sp. Isolate_219]
MNATDRPDEQGDEPTVGGTGATRDHNRRRLAARRIEVEETAVGRFNRQLLTLIAEFEEQREAERRQFEAAEGTALHMLAEGFSRATSTEKRHDLAEQIGSSLPIAEAGVIRRAAKALETAMPGVVVDARVDGWTAKEIADELDLTSSYVYRLLRAHPWEAQWALYVMPDGWTSDSDDEPWQRVADGIEESAGETADEVARRILDERLDNDLTTKRVRVAVWRTGDGPDLGDARGDVEHEPTE